MRSGPLLFPSHLDREARQRFRFHWVGFLEAGWSVASSFGLDRELAPLVPAADFRGAQFLAARKLRLTRRQVEQRAVTLAVVGDRWMFSDAVLADLAVRITGQQRRFFRESGLIAWFFEGFTTFYTRRLIYRDGLITLEQAAGRPQPGAGGVSPIAGAKRPQQPHRRGVPPRCGSWWRTAAPGRA